jgi:5-methylthioadenosine/S-adenosylhomocysteine deaminase
MALVVTKGLVVTFDDARRLIPNGAVRIDGGRIATVAQASEIEIHDSDTVIDASNGLVFPGFTNAHSHSVEVWARGRVEGMRLEAWLDAVFPPLDRLQPEYLRFAILLTASEMLKSGVTTVIDHFRQTPMREDAIAAAVDAYREVGVNAAIAIMLRDRPANPAMRAPAAELSSLCEGAISAWHAPERGISIMLGPSAPHRCSDALLETVGEISERRGIYIHTHLDENLSQHLAARTCYGRSATHHLGDLGLLGPRLSLAHAVAIDEEDIDLIAESHSSVVHNPISNARLGSGIAPVAELLARKVNVALGTDGAASNDSQNIVEVMKAAALLHGLRRSDDRTALSAFAIAAMATRAGGNITAGNHGCLAPGKRGDLIVVEADDDPFVPLSDVYRQIVYSGPKLRVRHSIIGGRHVVDHGRITTFDEVALRAEVRAAFRHIYGQREDRP